MKYSKEYIQGLKSRVRVSDVIKRYVDIELVGKNWLGYSPFKNENSPSFTANDEKRIFHCFSTGRNGDIFDIVRHFENMSFIESVAFIDSNYGGSK